MDMLLFRRAQLEDAKVIRGLMLYLQLTRINSSLGDGKQLELLLEQLQMFCKLREDGYNYERARSDDSSQSSNDA